MAHFYGSIWGNKGEATRMGSKDSGIRGYVQGHGSRVSSYMGAYDKKDTCRVTFEGGWNGYNAGSLTIAFNNFDDVTQVLGKGDKKIEAIVRRLKAEVDKLDDEAPAALKRIERRQKIEANRQERARKERMKAREAYFESDAWRSLKDGAEQLVRDLKINQPNDCEDWVLTVQVSDYLKDDNEFNSHVEGYEVRDVAEKIMNDMKEEADATHV